MIYNIHEHKDITIPLIIHYYLLSIGILQSLHFKS